MKVRQVELLARGMRQHLVMLFENFVEALYGHRRRLNHALISQIVHQIVSRCLFTAFGQRMKALCGERITK